MSLPVYYCIVIMMIFFLCMSKSIYLIGPCGYSLELFSLRAWNEVFFNSLMDFFALFNVEAQKEVKKSIKQVKNTPIRARSGNEIL